MITGSVMKELILRNKRLHNKITVYALQYIGFSLIDAFLVGLDFYLVSYKIPMFLFRGQILAKGLVSISFSVLSANFLKT